MTGLPRISVRVEGRLLAEDEGPAPAWATDPQPEITARREISS